MKLKTLLYLSLMTLVAPLSTAAHAQTFSVIYSGYYANPQGGVTIKGNALYTTDFWGTYDRWGAVFQITPSGSNWITAPIFQFPGPGNNGPTARVVFGPDGHLYGTTKDGGDIGYGSVYELTPRLTICTREFQFCYWKRDAIYSFAGGVDGAEPYFGDLTWDQQGKIYGTTFNGGLFGFGTVFRLSKVGDLWIKTTLYSFSGRQDGGNPANGVVFDSNGNLYGTASAGGQYSGGAVFKLTHVPEGGWQETVLHSFNGSDGTAPIAGLVFDNSGNLYGATSTGGSGFGGTVFELSPSGDAWIFQVLYSLSGIVGCGPEASLTFDTAGNLYDTSYCNGGYGQGNVFKLTNTENGWVYTSLHEFTGGNDGGKPISNVTFDPAGNLYGTASAPGVVWMIKP